MTKQDKINLIENNPCVAYWSEGLNGHEVHKIEYTPDGIIFYIKANVGCSNPTYHRRRVIEQFSSDGSHRDHVRIYGRRYYLDDCLRVRR